MSFDYFIFHRLNLKTCKSGACFLLFSNYHAVLSYHVSWSVFLKNIPPDNLSLLFITYLSIYIGFMKVFVSGMNSQILALFLVFPFLLDGWVVLTWPQWATLRERGCVRSRVSVPFIYCIVPEPSASSILSILSPFFRSISVLIKTVFIYFHPHPLTFTLLKCFLLLLCLLAVLLPTCRYKDVPDCDAQKNKQGTQVGLCSALDDESWKGQDMTWSVEPKSEREHEQ